MEILHGEVFPVKPGVDQDYDHDNPIVKLMALVEDVQLAAGREQYPSCELQYLFPIRELMLYGPKFPDSNVLDPNDPKQQDNKGDFQKQNVKSFTTADTQVVRGLASAGAWTGPFLWFSYRAGPELRACRQERRLAGPLHPAVGSSGEECGVRSADGSL